MLLWAFKSRPETRGEHMPYLAFRWAVEANRWSVGFVWQCKERDTGQWFTADAFYYLISIERWRWASDHYYYDGPHCALRMGWLAVRWTGGIWSGWCEKCMPTKPARRRLAGLKSAIWAAAKKCAEVLP